MDRQIAMLWMRGNLSFLEQLCVQSFLDAGHEVALYSYEPLGHVPDGVDCRDAAEVLPETAEIVHSKSGSPAPHADRWRYRLLSQRDDMIWADTDAYCRLPFRTHSGHFYGWESQHEVNIGVLGLPRDSETLARLVDFTSDEYAIPHFLDPAYVAELEAARDRGEPVHVGDQTWAVWGPKAFTHFLKETGEIRHAWPQHVLYPYTFAERRKLFRRGEDHSQVITDETVSIHLYGRRARKRFAEKDGGIPHPDSLVGQLLLKHRIDPCDAPLRDAPNPDRDHPHARLYREAASGQQAYTSAALPDPEPLPDLVADAVPATPPPASANAPFPMRTAADAPSLGGAAEIAYRGLMSKMAARHGRLVHLANPKPSERIVIVTSMKNEGAFIVEWIAYHISIGVTHFLVYTNDCDDPTNAVLDRLEVLGWVTRRDNPFNREAGQKPQRGALNDAETRPEVLTADWVGVIDVDEFVNIHVGDGHFRDLVEAAHDPNVISMTWKFFGNRGVHAYEDRWQTEVFEVCAPRVIPKPRLGWGFKSFYRPDGPFRRIGVHRPIDLDPDRAREVRWVNGSGHLMPERMKEKNEWFSRKDTIGYDLVTLNHYVLRSAESFLVKRQRGRVNHVDQDQGLTYWATRNYASETDTSIHARLPAARVIWHELMADSELYALHQAAVAWHRRRINVLMAEPDYRALYDSITNPDLPDAIWRAPERREAPLAGPQATAAE
jgi:hypothetical protein